MKRMTFLALSLILAGCGAGETVGVAAVQAKAAAEDVRAGKQLEAQTRAQVKQSLAADQKRLQDAEAASQ